MIGTPAPSGQVEPRMLSKAGTFGPAVPKKLTSLAVRADEVVYEEGKEEDEERTQ